MAVDTNRAKELFFTAAELTDAAARAAYLDQECSSDTALRARVEALLKAHAEPDDILDAPAQRNGTVDYAPISEKPGSMIGPYKLKEQIGEGGFGLVFVAEQQEPVKRKVALKVIKPGMDTREVMARFTAERQALALMDHPNIARVLDAGATESGRPYFVMELVRGIPITDYCDQNQLSPRDRLDLFVTVCQAVQHAHQKGIIHRDIKPSNVLVTSHDGKPVAKVIDFGVAKAIHQQLTDRSIYTNFAQMIGTPLYMSPEQAEMSGLDIDTRSDIYSLGVLLYELLTGSTPIDKNRFAKAAYDEIRRMIREDEPQKPSTRLSTSDSIASIAAQRHIEPAKLSKLLRGDLDWITMKALEKDRTRRYETANGLARDIQRYLSDEAVEACPPSAGYRLRKFARKNRALLTTAAAFAGLLATGAGVATWQAVRAVQAERVAVVHAEGEAQHRRAAEEQRDRAIKAESAAVDAKKRADVEAGIAKSVRDFLQNDLLAEAAPERNARDKKVTVEEILGRAAVRIPAKFENQPLIEAALRATIGSTYYRLGDHRAALPHLERAWELRRRSLGEEHPETLDSANNLALQYQAMGQFQLAEPMLVKTLEIRRRTFGAEHLETLTAMNSLGLLYQAQGQFAKAEPLQIKAVDIHRRMQGDEHPSTLIAMNNLAMLYQAQNQYSKAEQLDVRILEVRRRVLGEEHPETLTSMNNLAINFQTQGEYDRAQPLLERSLEITRRVRGEEHPMTVTAMNSLALLRQNQGRFTEAEALNQKALEIRRRIQGDEHPDTLTAMNNFALQYHLQGDFAKAEPIYVTTLTIRRRVLGPEHPHTIATLNNLAVLYQTKKEFVKAEPLFRDAVEVSRKRDGSDSLVFAAGLANLGWSLIGQDNPSDAEPLLRESLAIRETKEPDVWRTYNTKSLLGGALLGQKKYADAEPLLLAGYEGMKQREKTIPPPAMSRIREAIERFVQLYEAMDKKDEAAKWQKELEAIKAAPKTEAKR